MQSSHVRGKGSLVPGSIIAPVRSIPQIQDPIESFSRTFKVRHAEHMRAAQIGKWGHSGLTQHMEKCDGEIKGPEVICTVNAKANKNSMKHDLKEALYIKRLDCGPYKSMNLDNGAHVKTTQWDPVFAELNGQAR